MQHLTNIGNTEYVAFYDLSNNQWSTIANDSETLKKKFFDSDGNCLQCKWWGYGCKTKKIGKAGLERWLERCVHKIENLLDCRLFIEVKQDQILPEINLNRFQYIIQHTRRPVDGDLQIKYSSELYESPTVILFDDNIKNFQTTIDVLEAKGLAKYGIIKVEFERSYQADDLTARRKQKDKRCYD